MTSMVKTTLSLPPVLLPVTVYVPDAVTVSGVPETAPVDESRERPDGRDGETDHPVTAPPLTVGVAVVMAMSLVNVKEVVEYEMIGDSSLTTMVMVAVSLPPVLVAVMV